MVEINETQEIETAPQTDFDVFTGIIESNISNGGGEVEKEFTFDIPTKRNYRKANTVVSIAGFSNHSRAEDMNVKILSARTSLDNGRKLITVIIRVYLRDDSTLSHISYMCIAS